MRDVRPLKKQLREECLARRDAIDVPRREKMSLIICESITRLRSFEICKAMLAYVSFGSEVCTTPIIEYCLANGKPVAVPKCENRRQMEFYLISSFDDLLPGKYNIREPDPARCEKLTDLTDTFCLIPALSFDLCGNRLGYGGGYYDSFISGYPGTHIGLCYKECILPQLPTCRHDAKYDSILTEKGIILCRK